MASTFKRTAEASMIIEEISSSEFLAGLQKTRTVLIPLGATEGHGQHLPLGTDTFQAEDVCRLLAQRRDLFVAPSLPYGVCRSTEQHPGTLGIRTETLKQLVLDVVESLYRQGLRCFLILSGHAGGTHNAILIDAGEQVLKTYADVRIAVVTEYQLAYAESQGIIETTADSHAGEIETSRMLATRPQLVKSGFGAPDAPNFPKHILVRNKPLYWSSGIWGNPGKASREKGERIQEAVVNALDRLVTELENFREE
ncbi:MAG: creatininase family protein [Desulfuromonadales bacterium]